MQLCAFIGIGDAVRGLRAFVFVTAVDFTSTNLVQHQPVGYAIVAMEEVRIQRKTRFTDIQTPGPRDTDSLVKITLDNNIATILHAEIIFQFNCKTSKH